MRSTQSVFAPDRESCRPEPLVERDTDDNSVVGKVSALLDAFANTDREVGTSELARRTHLPKSTVHRLVGELVQVGLLEKGSGGFRLGLRLFEMGHRAPGQRELREAALPVMTALRSRTRQTVHLAVLDHGDVVYVDIMRSSDCLALPSRPGGRLPACATGVGKAMLALSPPATVASVLRRGWPRLTARTMIQPRLLINELQAAKRSRVAYDREEAAPGLVCAASPVIGRGGNVVGAISVSGRTTDIDLDRISNVVHSAAIAVADAMAN